MPAYLRGSAPPFIWRCGHAGACGHYRDMLAAGSSICMRDFGHRRHPPDVDGEETRLLHTLNGLPRSWRLGPLMAALLETDSKRMQRSCLRGARFALQWAVTCPFAKLNQSFYGLPTPYPTAFSPAGRAAPLLPSTRSHEGTSRSRSGLNGTCSFSLWRSCRP